MREKCERGHPFSTPGLRFHGVDRADVFNNIRVRAIRCGECALNSPTSQPIPRRSPSSTPAQRHARPEHFRSPTQRRCTPADRTSHSPPTLQPIPRRRPSPTPHSDTPSPSTSALPRSADVRPPTSQPVPRRPPSPAPAQRHALPSVPLRAQKNGTAQCMCDAECLGRPSLRSVIWVGEPRAVRRRCGALACRRGA